ncbi:helix-turn-helix domain-containing protein [Paracidovorax citrulli]
MRSLADIAVFLRNVLKASRVTQRELGEQAGIARRTLTGVLSGEADYKVSTLLAVLDRLGYQIAIVPKDAAAGLGAHPSFQPTQPAVKSVVASARERLLGTAPPDAGHKEPGR